MNYTLFIFLLLPVQVLAQTAFDSLGYDRIMVYEFRGDAGRSIVYCLDKEPARIMKRMPLAEHQWAKLSRLLHAGESYGALTASCFDPHHALVFYTGEEPVASIDICFTCNYLKSSLPIPALDVIHENYSGEEAPRHGFRRKARNEMKLLFRKWGFNRFMQSDDSLFDH